MAYRFTDQLSNTIVLQKLPERIISLVPSQTELLHYLELEDEVAGITKFCIHPTDWFRSKTRVGGTKTIKTDVVASLKPDLIIANKEENVKAQIEELREIAPVWISDVNNLDEALGMITGIGEITGRIQQSKELADKVRKAFRQLEPVLIKKKVAYLIWKDPYMAAGKETFIDDMLDRCGLENVFTEKRYPEISIEQIKEAGAQLVILSSEPYPFKEKRIAELQQQLPETKVILADGEKFSWYGSRLLKSALYFQQLLTNL